MSRRLGGRFPDLSKFFVDQRRTAESSRENTGERTQRRRPDQKKSGCRALGSRDYWSKCARASAARNLNSEFI